MMIFFKFLISKSQILKILTCPTYPLFERYHLPFDITAIFFFCSILGRIVRVTDEVVDYRTWIEGAFPPRDSNENDSLSSNSVSSSEPSESPITLSDSVRLSGSFMRYLTKTTACHLRTRKAVAHGGMEKLA